MNKIKFDNKSYKILGVQFNSEYSYRAAKSALASSSYEGFNLKPQSIRKIRDVIEGNLMRESLVASLKTGSMK